MRALIIAIGLLLLPYSVTWGGENKGFRVDCENIYPDIKVVTGYPQKCCTVITDSSICHYEHYDSVTEYFWVDTVFCLDKELLYDCIAGEYDTSKDYNTTCYDTTWIHIPCSTLVCEENLSKSHNLRDTTGLSVGEPQQREGDEPPSPAYPDTICFGGVMETVFAVIGFDKYKLLGDYCYEIYGEFPEYPPTPKCDTVIVTVTGSDMWILGYDCEKYYDSRDESYEPAIMGFRHYQKYRCVRCGE
jgi:hypothetical protein